VNPTLNKQIYHTLRIAAAMCCIGHGSFGIITKPIWCNYFAVFGIGHDVAYQLMPMVGCVDIFFGIMMLAYPMRAITAWLVVWGFITALLRPLSGEPFSEFVERAGNFGAPLALLIFAGLPKNSRSWFTKINANVQIDDTSFKRLEYCLRIIAFLLLLGHGWLNLVMKKGLLDQYTSLGFSNPQQVALMIGLAEVTAAFVLLIKPFRSLIFILFLWKISSEFFYPHYELFEWIERGGSYGVLLALWFVTERKNSFHWDKNRSAVISSNV
jgi:hypothetical protein